MKTYYAIFHKTKEAIEVEFPDLPGCVTFGDTWEETYEMAIDVLSAFLALGEPNLDINPPSTYEEIQRKKHRLWRQGEVFPVKADQKIMSSYEKTVRFNVTFPESLKIQSERLV